VKDTLVIVVWASNKGKPRKWDQEYPVNILEVPVDHLFSRHIHNFLPIFVFSPPPTFCRLHYSSVFPQKRPKNPLDKIRGIRYRPFDVIFEISISKRCFLSFRY
jgi:hypothetical protein